MVSSPGLQAITGIQGAFATIGQTGQPNPLGLPSNPLAPPSNPLTPPKPPTLAQQREQREEAQELNAVFSQTTQFTGVALDQRTFGEAVEQAQQIKDSLRGATSAQLSSQAQQILQVGSQNGDANAVATAFALQDLAGDKREASIKQTKSFYGFSGSNLGAVIKPLGSFDGEQKPPPPVDFDLGLNDEDF